MARIVIIGAGICGLGTALLLARDGHDVTVLERDTNEPAGSPLEAWTDWRRKGVAQFHQPHNFLPGMRLMLEAELPDIEENLKQAGAARFDLFNPNPFQDLETRAEDDRFYSHTTRRPAGEWVFLNAVAKEPRVNLRRGIRVKGLVPGPSAQGDVPHVAGVHTASGEEIRADLVVDAGGRGSNSPEWLAQLGTTPPYEEQLECGFVYYTRYFEGTQPQRVAPVMCSMGSISMLTLPADNGSWSVTIFASASDKVLKNLRAAENWSAVVKACPLHAHWLEGRPISDVLMMSGNVDRYRRFVVDGKPVVTGFVAVADAWACTNPSAGRGMTVGMHHAVQLRNAVREGIDRPKEFAMRFDEATESQSTPWYRAQVAIDRFRFSEMEALRQGLMPAPPEGLAADIASLFTLMPLDPEIFRAALQYVSTITPVQALLRQPELLERMAAARKTLGDAPPPAVPGPDREKLVTLVS